MRWRLILEEYSPELIYIQGDKNIVPDALSRLELTENSTKIKPEINVLAEHFALSKTDVPNKAHPTNLKTIMRYQQNDKELIETAKKTKIFLSSNFMGQENGTVRATRGRITDTHNLRNIKPYRK